MHLQNYHFILSAPFVKFFWKTNVVLLNTFAFICMFISSSSSNLLAVCSNRHARLLPNCCCNSVVGSLFLTCFHFFELLLELLRSEAVVVEAIVPFDSLQHL